MLFLAISDNKYNWQEGKHLVERWLLRCQEMECWWSYYQLTENERYRVYALKKAGPSQKK